MSQYVYFTDGHKEEILECYDVDDGGKIVRTASGYYRKFIGELIGKMDFSHDGTVIWDDVTNIIQTYAVDGDLTPYRVDMRLEEFWIRGVLYSKNEDLSMPAIIELIHKRLKGDASVLFDYELSISQGGFK